MRKTLPLSGALLLALCACSPGDLPGEYRRLEVPTERLSSSAAKQQGRELFLEHCAICHGERADGHGRRRNLSSPPQNFTDPGWRERSSPRRVFYVISEGVRGTAMAGWKTLEPEEIWDLVAYLRSVAD